MRTPTTELSSQEKILTPTEVAKLPCATEIRAKATELLGITKDVEIVSHHPFYGYIFRYSVGPLENKNGFGGIAFGKEFKDTYIIWTDDCNSFHGAFDPGFTIPASLRQK